MLKIHCVSSCSRTESVCPRLVHCEVLVCCCIPAQGKIHLWCVHNFPVSVRIWYYAAGSHHNLVLLVSYINDTNMLAPLNLGQLNIVRIKIWHKRPYLLDFNAFLWQSILCVCVCVCGEIVWPRVWTRWWLRACERFCVCVCVCVCVWRDCVTARVNKVVTTRVWEFVCVFVWRDCVAARVNEILCVCVCVCKIFSLPREGGCHLLSRWGTSKMAQPIFHTPSLRY